MRRLLREHRKTMRVYAEVLDDSDQMGVFLNRLAETDAQIWVLANDSELDETSDAGDPEAELCRERDTTHAFVQAAQDALMAEALRRDLERKSMEFENLRGHLTAPACR